MVGLGIDIIQYFSAKSIHKAKTIPSEATSYSQSLIPDYQAFRNTWWGQPQPVSYDFIWKAYLMEPIVRSCVDITVDAIIGDGWGLESKNKRHEVKIKKVFKNSNFQKFLQDMVTSLIIYGDAYAEKIRANDGILEYLCPVDSATIRIDYDQSGRIYRYIQRVLHRRIQFYPDELVHFSLNNIGGRVYGVSPLQSVIFTIKAKMSAQDFNTEYFRRPGLPRSIWISKNLSDAQNNKIITALKTTTPQSDLFVQAGMGEIEHQTVAPNNQDMQFIELVNFLRQEIIAAMGVPPVFLGITEGSNRSNSQTQLEAWDRRKKKMRLMIQDIINQEILNTQNFGFDDVRFVFKDENSREKLKYGQLAQLISTIPYITPNQILDILDLPPLEDKKFRYDSSSGEIDEKTEEIGDTPIYILQQQQAEQMQNSNMNNPNAQNPNKSQEKEDNAQRLNAEQAQETRNKFFTKADPSKDYTYGAYPVEPEVADKSNWKILEDRFKEIILAQQRVLTNVNREFKEEDSNFNQKPKTTPTKAVFYSGITQLEE